MAKITKGHLRVLYEGFEKACNAYLVALIDMWELDYRNGFWVGDEVGGVYSYGDTGMYIDMDDIRYCVVHGVTKEQYWEYMEYVLWASEFEQNIPELKDWLNGFKRVSEGTMNRLSDMKAELMRLVEETKEMY